VCVCVSVVWCETNFVCLVNISTVLQQERDNFCVAILTCRRKRSGAILRNKRVGFFRMQVVVETTQKDVSVIARSKCVCVCACMCVCVCVCIMYVCVCDCVE